MSSIQKIFFAMLAMSILDLAVRISLKLCALLGA